MTQQWQLSGNAENVDWSDIAMAGRAYADNLVGEPAVSKVMHMMADEIERLRAVIRPESHAKNDENRILYDTKRDTTQPRNGALSGCETVPDPDSRVWDTPCTPQPHATTAQGSVQGDGSIRDSRNANDPVAWAVMPANSDYCVTLSCRREAAQKAAERKVEVGEYGAMDDIAVVPLYLHPRPTLTDAERESLRIVSSVFPSEKHAATLRGLLERLGAANSGDDRRSVGGEHSGSTAANEGGGTHERRE